MIKKIKFLLFSKIFCLFFLITSSIADSHNISELLEDLQKDIKTLEKAVYANSSSNETNLTSSLVALISFNLEFIDS